MCLPVKPYKIEREWEHEGLKCAVVQAREGEHRCGYVRVPPVHPMHRKSYDYVDVEVHGGLTFAQIEPCAHDDGTGWWFGFDCAHFGDSAQFWTQQKVEQETETLARQLAGMLEKEGKK